MSLNDRVAARVVMVTISHECRFLKEEDILKIVASSSLPWLPRWFTWKGEVGCVVSNFIQLNSVMLGLPSRYLCGSFLIAEPQ